MFLFHHLFHPQIIGKFGRKQQIHIFVLALIQFFFAYHMLLLAFVGKDPSSITCKGRPAEETCSADQPECVEYVYDAEFTSIVTEVRPYKG